MDSEASYIDITNVYLVGVGGIKYIAKLENPHKLLYRFVDVFAIEEIWSGLGYSFEDAFERYVKIHQKQLFIRKIKECEPALLAYPDNLVPDYVLRQVFYNENNVDLNNPVLKKVNE